MHILIFTIQQYWIGIARLPKVLQEAGFKVGVLCFPKSYIAKTRYLDKLFLLESPGNTLLKSLRKAIEVWRPVLLIPGDELTVRFLHLIVRLATTNKLNSLPIDVVKTIQSSLCSPDFYEAATNKTITQRVAREIGLRTPAQQSFDSVADALSFKTEYSYPVVLKKSFGTGGSGVKICDNSEQLMEALHNFQPLPAKPPSIKSLIKNWLRELLRSDLDPVQLNPAQLPDDPAVSIQQFISGKPAMYCLVAIAGKTLAGYTAVKEIVNPSPTGMSSVIHFIKQPEMASAASALMTLFNYTGFASIEFMIEEKTGFAYLLECNPRPTSVNHLGEKVGVNLCGALFQQLNGKVETPSLSADSEMVVALFPQEWQRDPNSNYLLNTYHDVPWDDPMLVRAYIGIS